MSSSPGQTSESPENPSHATADSPPSPVADSRPPDTLRPALRQNFLFRDLTDDELDALSHEIELARYNSAALIVSEDEPADSLYLVVEGAVNVMKSNGQF